MTDTPIRMRSAARLFMAAMILLLAFGGYSFAQGERYKSEKAWAFGVMGDTQWTVSEDPEGKNPEYVSAAVAGALQERFIDSGVKFVIQVGDLTDRAGDAGLAARAAAAQTLYDAGIGFFPLRGNHESYGYLYNRDPEWNLNIPAFRSNFPQTQGLSQTFGAKKFSGPQIDALLGLSYSFDYGKKGSSARFVVVDVEPTSYITIPAPIDSVYGQGYFYISWVVFKATATVPGGAIPAGAWFRIDSKGKPSTNFYGYDQTRPINDYIKMTKYDSAGTEVWPGSQREWISAQLDKTTRGTEHAFVFSHRPMMGANHVDGFFGKNPSVNEADQNAFYASLMNNDVKFMISAHDHIHNRALVASPDGASQVEQLISVGSSTKFYTPGSLDSFGNAKQRETELSQEIYNIGYYVYTVDGPRVTVDYYSDSVGNFLNDNDYPRGDASSPARLFLPAFDFVKKESWGYSLNGKEFKVAPGGSYTAVQDSFDGTTAAIIGGTNNSTAVDYTPVVVDAAGVTISAPRPFTKVVRTGWAEKPRRGCKSLMFSDVLSVWGMADFGSEKTDQYVLSMKQDFRNPLEAVVAALAAAIGKAGIATVNAQGNWVNAVDLNMGESRKKFVVGPYKPTYGLGTYGLDLRTGTVWAVIDYNADFALATFAK